MKSEHLGSNLSFFKDSLCELWVRSFTFVTQSPVLSSSKDNLSDSQGCYKDEMSPLVKLEQCRGHSKC